MHRSGCSRGPETPDRFVITLNLDHRKLEHTRLSRTFATSTIAMSGKFEPKVPVTLNPPKDDPISLEELAKADGMYCPGHPPPQNPE